MGRTGDVNSAATEISVRGSGETDTEKKLASHTVESAALYAVVSRLDSAEIPTGLDLVDKVLLFDRAT